MKEVFKVIHFAPNYAVSNLGRVKRVKRNPGSFLEGGGDRGWVSYCIRTNENKYKRIRAHRLVMTMFKGHSDLGINHINGIKSDNRLENLEYCSHLENVRHAIKIGLIDNHGEKSGKAKYKNHQILEVDKMLRDGYRICDIARKTKFRPTHIVKIMNGEIWYKLTGRPKYQKPAIGSK